MENAVDALKMGFAVLVFTMALSLAIYMYGEANRTAEIVLHSSDITQYMEYEEVTAGTESRVVGIETVIPTLYKYYKENYTVIFRTASGNFKKIYETEMKLGTPNELLLDPNIDNSYLKKYTGTNKEIYSFDLDEEIKRHEPWIGSAEECKKNIDAFLSGGTYYFPSASGKSYIYDDFINTYKDKDVIENIGEYTYNMTNDEIVENDTNSAHLKSKKKRVIIYTLPY